MIDLALETQARYHLAEAYKASRAHSRLAQSALKNYGDHGSLISGIVRDHFPEFVKTGLRTLARSVGTHLDESRRLWRASGRRHASWMKAKEREIAEKGRGFYG